MAASLEREDQLRRALVADVAHELRTPVAILQAETEALVDGVTAPRPRRWLAARRSSAAGADGGGPADPGVGRGRRPAAPAPPPGPVGRVADRGRGLAGLRFRAADVRLHQLLPPTLVMGDPHRLHQVVANLLANAVKFTPPGGTVSVCVSTEGPDPCWSRRTPARAFPNTSASRLAALLPGETGPMAMGNGIGLAVVKELVDAHGGTVGVDDGPGRGARFFVLIPLATTVGPDG